VGVKVYGSRPSILSEIRNTMRDASTSAQLWPPTLMGIRSWDVNRLMNQP